MKNKKFRKIVGLILSVCCILTCISIPVMADTELTGVEGSSATNWTMSITNGSMMVSTSAARTGKAAIYSRGDVAIYQTISNLPAGTYKLGIWVYDPNNVSTIVRSDISWKGNPDEFRAIVKSENGWNYYEQTITLADAITNAEARIRMFNFNGPVLIDDMTLTNEAGQELLTNASFEENTLPKMELTGIENTKPENWSISITNGAMMVSESAARTGKVAMYSRGDVGISQSLKNLPAGDYKLGVWVYDPNNVTTIVRVDISAQGGADDFMDPIKSENGWNYYEKTITLTENYADASARVRMFNFGGPVLFDDVTVTNAAGEQLLTNTSFEDYIVPMELNGIEFSSPDEWIVTVTNGTMLVSETAARTGKAAMYAQGDVGIYQRLSSLPAGEYKLGFWAFDPNEYGTIIRMDISWQGGSDDFLNPVKRENGWNYYEKTITLDQTFENAEVRLRTFNFGGPILFDDMTLTNSEGRQLLSNTSFEKYTLPSKAVLNLVAYPAVSGNAVYLSWDNPNYNISSISVKQNGEELSDVTVDTTALHSNAMLIPNLENGKEYTYTVTTTVGDETYPVTVTAIPNSDANSNYAGKNKIGAWTVSRNDAESDGSMHYANINTNLDFEEKSSGDTSFVFDGNLANTYANVYSRLSQEVTLRKDRKYMFYVKVKTSGTSAINVLEQSSDDNCGALSANLLTISDGNTGSTSWTEYSCQLATENDAGEDIYNVFEEDETYKATLSLNVTKLMGSAWVDDAALYMMDEAGEFIEGDNLLQSGGFEFVPYTVSAKCGTMTNGEFVETGALAAGTNYIKAAIKNENAGSDFKATVVTALYKNGKLEKLQTLSKSVAEGAWYEPTEEYTFKVDVPAEETSAYTAKVFFWNSLGEMQPLDGAVEF